MRKIILYYIPLVYLIPQIIYADNYLGYLKPNNLTLYEKYMDNDNTHTKIIHASAWFILEIIFCFKENYSEKISKI